MAEEQQRQHFRIDYPMANRASVLIRDRQFEIIDLSQRGIKISIENNSRPEGWMLHENIMGAISLMVGKRHIITGRVIRVGEFDIIIHLDQDIPLGLVNEEHRFIIQKFGK